MEKEKQRGNFTHVVKRALDESSELQNFVEFKPKACDAIRGSTVNVFTPIYFVFTNKF